MGSDRPMTSYAGRSERTLPAGTTSAEDVESTTNPNTVRRLSPPGPHAAHDDSEAFPGTGRQAELLADEGEPTADGHRSTTAGNANRRTGVFRTFAKIVAWMAVFPILSILPFLVVLRISVLAYQENTHDGWQALVIGISAAVVLVCVYIAVFMWTFGIRHRFFMPLLNVCLTAMLCYSGFALFHLAVSNAKTEEIRSYYTSLHPFLRVAVKNLTIVDEDLVITDVQRTKAAYRDMGLPPRDYSLHFKQSTGFVHAVDIRTAGRSKITNLTVELYFILMGFQTIRHVGTADHLHVSLPLIETDPMAASSVSESSD